MLHPAWNTYGYYSYVDYSSTLAKELLSELPLAGYIIYISDSLHDGRNMILVTCFPFDYEPNGLTSDS